MVALGLLSRGFCFGKGCGFRGFLRLFLIWRSNFAILGGKE